jgi:hypothetical protein
MSEGEPVIRVVIIGRKLSQYKGEARKAVL